MKPESDAESPSFTRSDVVRYFLARDYVRVLRAGLELRNSTSDFEIDLLLLNALGRLDQPAMLNALSQEMMPACGAFPWMEFLLQVTLGQTELVDPDQIESGERRCQYSYFAGERLLTLGDREMAEGFFARCVQEDHACLDNILAQQQWSALRRGDSEQPLAQIGDVIDSLDLAVRHRLKAGELEPAVVAMEELVDLADFFHHSRADEWRRSLAQLYGLMGRPAEARVLIEQQLEGDSPPARKLELLVKLAESHYGEEAWDLALGVYRQLLEDSSSAAGYETYQAAALNGIGLVYLRLQDKPRAGNALGKALAIRRELLGDDHADTAITLHNLAEALSDSDPEAAEKAYREAVDVLERSDSGGSQRLALAWLSLCH